METWLQISILINHGTNFYKFNHFIVFNTSLNFQVRKSLKGQLRDSTGQIFERNWHKPENSSTSDSESELALCSLPSTSSESIDGPEDFGVVGYDPNNLFDEDRTFLASRTISSAINIAVFGVVTVCISTFIIYKCLKKVL